MAVNANPSQDANCESLYYPLQNANFNVIGLTDAAGMLVERYEYTPYGERTVFKKAGASDVLTTAPLYHSQPVLADGQAAPYGLCDFGHQGLQHDKEFGWWYNRFRYGDPMGRWPQRDRLRYEDGTNMYTLLRDDPVSQRDPKGEKPMTCERVRAVSPASEATAIGWLDGGDQQWVTYAIIPDLGTAVSSEDALYQREVAQPKVVYIRRYVDLYKCCNSANCVRLLWGTRQHWATAEEPSAGYQFREIHRHHINLPLYSVTLHAKWLDGREVETSARTGQPTSEPVYETPDRDEAPTGYTLVDHIDCDVFGTWQWPATLPPLPRVGPLDTKRYPLIPALRNGRE